MLILGPQLTTTLVLSLTAGVGAQLPLPPSLRDARTAYLEQGPALRIRHMDNAAKEILKFKPRVLELVDDPAKADIVLTLSYGGAKAGGVMVIPMPGGAGAIAMPLTDEVYVLRVRDAKTSVTLWTEPTSE